jgi:hypothetical protein
VKSRKWNQLLRKVELPTFLLLPVLSVHLFGQQEKSTPPTDKTTAQYAGGDTCKTCHEDLYKNNFERTSHFKTTLQGGHGCESCHGPGSEHVAGGGDISKIISFKGLSRQKSDARCLTCHSENHEQRHFSSSAHASNDVGCLDCHSPHQTATPLPIIADIIAIMDSRRCLHPKSE